MPWKNKTRKYWVIFRVLIVGDMMIKIMYTVPVLKKLTDKHTKKITAQCDKYNNQSIHLVPDTTRECNL